MQKVIGMLIVALALWTAAEVYSNGFAGAFGGAFASVVDEEEQDAEFTWAGERAGNKLRDKHQDRVDAIDEMTRQ